MDDLQAGKPAPQFRDSVPRDMIPAMPTRRSRRQLLSAACAAFTAGAIWPSALRAGDGPESGAFKFIAVNDIHYRDKECGPWLTAAYKQMASHEGVEFCLLLGDL